MTPVDSVRRRPRHRPRRRVHPTPRRGARQASRRASAAVVLAVALGLVGFTTAVPAQAHNVLISTDPVGGSTVAVLPDAVDLHFDLPSQALGTAVVVRGPSGEVADGTAELIDDDVEQPIRTGSPAGRYTVEWRVVSADGHVVQGTFTFTAHAASTGTAPPLPSARHALAAAAPGGGIGVGWWIVAGVVMVLLLVGAALALRGRGVRAAADDEDPDADDDPDDD